MPKKPEFGISPFATCIGADDTNYRVGHKVTANSDISSLVIYEDRTCLINVRGEPSVFMTDSIETLSAENYDTLYLGYSSAGNIDFYSRTQELDTDWPAEFNEEEWDLIDNGEIQSTPNNYLKIAVVMDFEWPGVRNDVQYPVYFDSMAFDTAIATLTISIANFTGMTVKDAIQNFAEMCDYAFGFRHDDKFFFREKVFKDSPDILIADHTDIRNYEIDWGRIINRVSTTHGGYTAMLDSKTEDSDRPDSIDKYGIRPVSLSFSPIVGDPDADIAFGISNLYWQKYGELLPEEEAKKHFELSVLPKFGLELGDVIRVDKYPGAYPNLRRYADTSGELLTYTTVMQYKEAPPYGSLAYLGRISIDLNRFNMELTAREL